MPDGDLFGVFAPPLSSAGVDEVGRGPLAGPVYAAAVVLGGSGVPDGVRDSKKLSARRRESLAEVLKGCVQAYALGVASVEELLRVVDPEFDTPAANDYIAASAITFPIAIPYVLMADWPGYGFRDGNPIYYWMTAGVLAAYLAYTFICYGFITRKNPKSKDAKCRLWKPMDDDGSDD